MLRSIVTAAVIASSLTAAAATLPAAPPAAAPSSAARLTAAEIVLRNVAARGGLDAWRRVETMAWIGRVEGGSPVPMPFSMEMKRPNKTRFEITSNEQRFLRIFDGARGWRVRPGANGTPDAKRFPPEEADFARGEFVIDGPLIDYEAKGITVRLAGVNEIEGRKAYQLELQLPSGASRRVWIDTETYLEVRADRPSTNPVAKGVPVSVFYRDYRKVDGLLVPMTIETHAPAGDGRSQKLVITKVVLNPSIPDTQFGKPPTALQRNSVARVGGDPGPLSAGAPHPAAR